MRRLPIFVLICLLFASGWSPVLAAAFCPRAEGHDCCAAESAGVRHDMPAHHQGADMDGMEAMRPAHAHGGHAGWAAALDRQIKDCAHCVAHSGGTNVPAVTFSVPGNSGKDAASAPPQVQRFFFPASLSQNRLISSRPHGPPVEKSPRHLLINVFLI
jgi:hypothetical protein